MLILRFYDTWCATETVMPTQGAWTARNSNRDDLKKALSIKEDSVGSTTSFLPSLNFSWPHSDVFIKLVRMSDFHWHNNKEMFLPSFHPANLCTRSSLDRTLARCNAVNRSSFTPKRAKIRVCYRGQCRQPLQATQSKNASYQAYIRSLAVHKEEKSYQTFLPLSMLSSIQLCTWAGFVFERCNQALRIHVHRLLFAYLCSAGFWENLWEKIKADSKWISQGVMVSRIRHSLCCQPKVQCTPTCHVSSVVG